MRKQPFMLLAFLFVVSLASLAPVHAQNREAAERFFRAGERAFDAGQYVPASQAFEEAYKRLPLPAIAFSAAQSHRLQYFIDKDPSRLKRSIELYRLYIKEVTSGGRRQDAVTGLSELEPILERIEAQEQLEGRGPIEARPQIKAETRLMISSQTKGARVAIDQGEPATMPVVTQVEPGEHKVKFTAKGFYPIEKTVVAVDGQLLPVEATLKPKPALVKLQAESGALVSVDGRPAGQSPMARPLELSEGRHFISIARNGRHAWSREVEVKRGQELKLEADLRSTTQRKVSYWVFGASAVTFVASGIYAGMSLHADGQADDILQRTKTETLLPEDRIAYEEYRASRNDRRRAATLLAGLGGGLALTGVLLYLIDTPATEMAPTVRAPGPETPAELSFVPLLGPDIAGLGATSRF